MVEGAMSGPALLRLLTWLSPAFPTGGFAYSHGLEWSVEAGDVRDEASLTSWIGDLLAHGALWSDVILLRQAWRAPNPAALAELGTALAPCAERRLETCAQGAAFALAAASWPAPALQALADGPLPYPVAVGALATAQDVAEDDAALAFLHAAVANLVSAAVRLIPLGQAAGLRVQAALEPAILATEGATRMATLDELGTAAWASDIAAMRHETQYTRLFRT
jgi:urease accessory protein